MDLLKGIISISLLGNKQFLRYQLHFSLLLTFPERTNPRVCKFCLLFAVILEFVILQIQLRLFSPPEFASLPLLLRICQVMLNFRQYWVIPLQLLLVTKTHEIVLLSASSVVSSSIHGICFMKVMRKPNYQPHNLPIHSTVSPYISSYN